MRAVIRFGAMALLVTPVEAQQPPPSTFGQPRVTKPATVQPVTEEKPITIEELRRRGIVGQLGMPLGTAVEIQATVIRGRDLLMKGNDDNYLLNVSHVNGKPLTNIVRMEFQVPPYVSASVASTPFGLYEIKTHQRPRSLSTEQITELEKGYVGKTVKLAVHELGHFSGMPRNMLPGAPIVQSQGFHFSTYLSVLVDRHVEQRKFQKSPTIQSNSR